MKLHKILITLLTAATISSCTNGFEDMNKDPLAVSEISPDLSLPYMQYTVFISFMVTIRELHSCTLSFIANIWQTRAVPLLQIIMSSTVPGRNADSGLPTTSKW